MIVTDYYMNLGDNEKLIYRHGFKKGQNEKYTEISEDICEIFNNSSDIFVDIMKYFNIIGIGRYRHE